MVSNHHLKRSQHQLRVRINVSGKMFESFKKTLRSKPGSIFHHQKSIKRFYCEESREYRFNRDYRCFEAIFVYLQCGLLKKPEKATFKKFIEELIFYGFEDQALELYNKELMKVNSIINPHSIHDENLKTTETLKQTSFEIAPLFEGGNKSKNEKRFTKQNLRAKLNDMFNKPDTSVIARLLSIWTILVVFLSIFAYCLATYPGISKIGVQRLDMFESACNVWFTLEFSIRFLLSYNKKSFFKNFINIVDFVSIVPFYTEMLTGGNENFILFSFLRMVKVTRVFRILKVSRYSVAMHIILMTVRASLHEISVLMFFIFTSMVFFASLIYQFEMEMEAKSEMVSIPHAFWLVIITITTVGYGDDN